MEINEFQKALTEEACFLRAASPLRRRHAVGKNESDLFEQQIERIHRLLEESDASVTWNDRVPDPDNPDQARQIDILIELDGKVTHVECRIHKKPQDVKWIEELIGRRASLRVDTIIAVSSSGFTDGAVKKAAQFAIPLRTLQDLTEEEVRVWSLATGAKAIFYEFTDTVISFNLPPLTRLPWPAKILTDDAKPINWRELFKLVMDRVHEDEELDNCTKHLTIELFAPLLVSGIRPTKMDLSCAIRRVTRELPLDVILKYLAIDDTASSMAHVFKYDQGTIEVLQSSDELAVVYDMTTFVPPANCLFYEILIDAGRTVLWKWFKLVEAHRAMAFNGFIRHRFNFD
jgi:Restriction endonuclease